MVVNNDPELLEHFFVDGKKPITVIRVDIDAVYFQCARKDVPTAGQMTKSGLSDFDAELYDSQLGARQKTTLY